MLKKKFYNILAVFLFSMIIKETNCQMSPSYFPINYNKMLPSYQSASGSPSSISDLINNDLTMSIIRQNPTIHLEDRSADAAAKRPDEPPPPPPPPPASSPPANPGGVPEMPHAKIEENAKNIQLQRLVQQLYVAQAQVQLEATEIQRAQSIAGSAQQNLEEAANNVRVLTAALRAAQEAVASSAMRAQTAQLQLAAHDQLLFTARQRVDALSAQMVGLQAEVGIGDNKISVDLQALLTKLKEPLREDEKPKAVPSILPLGGSANPQNTAQRIDEALPEFRQSPAKHMIYSNQEHNMMQNRQFNQDNEEKNIFKEKRSNTKRNIDSINDVNLIAESNNNNNENNKPVKNDDFQLTANDIKEFLEYIHQYDISQSNSDEDDLIQKKVNEETKTIIDDTAKQFTNEKYFNEFLSNIKNSNLGSIDNGEKTQDNKLINDNNNNNNNNNNKNNKELEDNNLHSLFKSTSNYHRYPTFETDESLNFHENDFDFLKAPENNVLYQPLKYIENMNNEDRQPDNDINVYDSKQTVEDRYRRRTKVE